MRSSAGLDLLGTAGVLLPSCRVRASAGVVLLGGLCRARCRGEVGVDYFTMRAVGWFGGSNGNKDANHHPSLPGRHCCSSPSGSRTPLLSICIISPGQAQGVTNGLFGIMHLKVGWSCSALGPIGTIA